MSCSYAALLFHHSGAPLKPPCHYGLIIEPCSSSSHSQSQHPPLLRLLDLLNKQSDKRH